MLGREPATSRKSPVREEMIPSFESGVFLGDYSTRGSDVEERLLGLPNVVFSLTVFIFLQIFLEPPKLGWT